MILNVHYLEKKYQILGSHIKIATPDTSPPPLEADPWKRRAGREKKKFFVYEKSMMMMLEKWKNHLPTTYSIGTESICANCIHNNNLDQPKYLESGYYIMVSTYIYDVHI